MLRILGKATSINVRKVLWTCAELELKYRLEEWGAGFRDTHDPAFLALNPNALVPVLVDDDFVLWESNSICRYLVHNHGRTDLLPTEARPRACVEQWMDWQATELNTAWRYAFMHLVRKSPAHADPAQLADSERQWNAQMALLDAKLATTHAWVTGPAFTLADVVLGLSTHRWLSTPLARPQLRHVEAYYERCSKRPGFMLHGRNGVP